MAFRHRHIVESCRKGSKYIYNLRRNKSDGFDVKQHDETIYGGWKSAEVLFSEPKDQAPRLIGRWDWHFWHFLIALIPGAAVYGLAQWARHDMKNNTAYLDAQQQPSVSDADQQAVVQSQMDTRLSELEKVVQKLLQIQEKKKEEQPPGGAPGLRTDDATKSTSTNKDTPETTASDVQKTKR